MFAAAARITRAVSLPVTVDAEAGYGLPAAELVDRLLAAGAVGCNLEDTDYASGGLKDLTAHADWLASVRSAADAAGVPLVINARVDVFLRAGAARGGVDEAALVEPALERAHAYFAAGADCVYPIVARDPAAIRAFIDAAGGPVNLLSMPGAPSPADAAKLGAARVSMGGGLWRTTLAGLADRLAELRGELTG
jgi:2-methylisocitrate lyase-like PEP mutase family enzyme